VGPRCRKFVYISEVNGVRKVKSNAQIAEQELRTSAEIVSMVVGWEGHCPQLIIFQTSEIV